jgi:phosphatidylglycerol:prolipoprotein diacylglycerol transferase
MLIYLLVGGIIGARLWHIFSPPPTNLPWAIFIDPKHRMTGFEDQAYYHPLFLYESLCNLANMLVLLWLGRRFGNWHKPGDLFLIYMLNYAIVRFSLDFLRLDASQVLGINFNQTAMAITFVAALLVLIWRHKPMTSELTPNSSSS